MKSGNHITLQRYGSESRPSSHCIGFKDDDVAVKAVMESQNEATVAKFGCMVCVLPQNIFQQL